MMDRRTFIKSSMAFPLLLTARKSLAQNVWTPLDRFADRRGDVIRVSSSAAPRYTFDGLGALIPIDMAKQDTVEEIGGKQFAVKTSSPISSGFQRDSTSAIDVVRSDLDWQYSDRRMEWELVGADFGGVERMPRLAAQQKISAAVRSVGDDYRIATTRTAVRRAVRVPAKLAEPDFCITYILRLVDLQIANEVDKSGFYIPDAQSGNFRVTTPGGDGRFEIRLPKLFDANWQLIQSDAWHTLRQIGKNTYEYCKLSGKTTLKQLQAATWIDADTTLTDTSNDGYSNKTSGSWAESIAATTGSTANNTGEYTVRAPSARATGFDCYRTFIDFTTTSISSSIFDTLTGLTVQVRGYPGGYTCNVSLFQGTQSASLATTDYDSFTGSELARVAWNQSGWNSFSIPVGSFSVLIPGSTTKFAFREYDHDVVGAPPTNDEAGAGMYFNESSYDPLLILTTELQNPISGIIRNYYNRRLIK